MADLGLHMYVTCSSMDVDLLSTDGVTSQLCVSDIEMGLSVREGSDFHKVVIMESLLLCPT